MKWFAVFLAAALLSGCATMPPDPVIVTKTVNVPVAVKCAPNPPPVKPDFAAMDAAIKAAPDIFETAKLIAIRELAHVGYEGEQEAALAGCTG